MIFEGTKEQVKAGKLDPKKVIKELRDLQSKEEYVSEKFLSWLRNAGQRRYDKALKDNK